MMFNVLLISQMEVSYLLPELGIYSDSADRPVVWGSVIMGLL
jgi:hypothetical protein